MKFKPILVACILIVGGLFAVHRDTARASDPSHDHLTGSQEVWAASSDAFWQNWTVPTKLSGPTTAATFPTLGVTAGGQRLYVAWTDGRALSKDIYYTTSSNGGAAWTSPDPVVPTAADSWRPSLALSGSTPFIAWAESVPPVSHATYQGVIGSGSMVTVPNDRTTWANVPRLAAGPGGELHIALQGGWGSQTDILYSRRDAGATVWPAATAVFTHTTTGSFYPAIGVSADGQAVHLVWQENFGAAQSEIYYLRGQRSGNDTLWDPAVSLSAGLFRSVRPAIMVDPTAGSGLTLHMAWGEQDPNHEVQYVRYSRSDDGGENWSASRRVSSEPVGANNVAPTDVAPALAVTPSGALCVAWHGFRSGVVIEAEEIYLACSTSGGAQWSAPVEVSHSPNVISIRPVMAVGSNGILHLAWQELAAGGDPTQQYQIYYAHTVPYSVMMPIVWR
jgi:hypothetical protein